MFENNYESRVAGSLKIAVLNALSSGRITESDYKIVYNTDPFDLVEFNEFKTITIVGAFQSYIKRIANTKIKLNVLELDENALTEEQKKNYVPAEKYSEILPESDLIIITGLTLVNETLDNLLSCASENSKIIVTGPSSSILPDVLFQKNVNIVGATKITDPDIMFNIVSEAGTGYHLFKYCAEKYCIVNEYR